MLPVKIDSVRDNSDHYRPEPPDNNLFYIYFLPPAALRNPADTSSPSARAPTDKHKRQAIWQNPDLHRILGYDF